MAHRSHITKHDKPVAVAPMFQVEGYGIFQWHPTPDGSGPPEAVVLQLNIREFPYPIGLRFKSRAAADEFTLAFTDHVNQVWPSEKVEKPN